MGIFGGSSSSSQSSNNNINFNPVINVGDDNTADTSSRQKGESDSSATTKDEFGLTASAGVALAPGSSASGGEVSSIATDPQPMSAEKANDNFFQSSNINPMYVIGGLGVLTAIILLKKK